MTFKIKIYTPLGLYFEGDITSLYIKTITGYRTILPGHIDLLAALDDGECIIKEISNLRCFFICGGVLKLENNVALVLVHEIYSKEELNLLDLENKLNNLETTPNPKITEEKELTVQKSKLIDLINFLKNK